MRRACVKRGCGTSCLSISGLRFSLHASPRDPAVICLAPGCVSGGKCGVWCLSQFCIVGALFRGSKCINLPRSNSFDLIYTNFVVKPVSINLFLQTSSHQTYMNQSCLSFYPEAGPISTLYHLYLYQFIVVTLVCMLQRALLKHSCLHGFASCKAA